ncbi:glycosyltransferase family 9 protein [Calditerrivibrio nitroreducens]|uniref:glycosyltransferase family 9 protein n=1 Tax=Calditerrivibrio TaxID=545865 RepID=UPI003C72A8AB
MKKILLIRLSAIGDIVFATTMLKPLKESGKVKIYWLVNSPLSSILYGNVYIDEIISLPVDRWKWLFKKLKFVTLIIEILQFVRKLNKYQFDISIDLHGILKGSIWAFLSGSKEKIGLGKKEFNWIFLDKVYPRGGDVSFFASEYLYLAELLGCEITDKKPFLSVPQETKNNVKQNLLSNVKDKFFVIAPFTTRPQKHWIEIYWQELLKRILSDYPDNDIIILGGKNDYDAAERLVVHENVKNFSGKTKLAEAMAIIYLSVGIIGVDTGLTHMGTAFEKNTIAIFGSTVPYLTTANPKTKVLYAGLSCSPCKRNPTCNNRFDCMHAITPEMVYKEFTKLVDL